MPYAVPRARVAPSSNPPAGPVRRLSSAIVAISIAVALVALDVSAPVSASQLVGVEAASFTGVLADSASNSSSRPTPPTTSTRRPADDDRTPPRRSRERTPKPPETSRNSSGQRSGTARGEARRIIAVARRHVGARFRLGAEGPRYFDCSGLVYRVYAQAGLLGKIGGSRRLAAGYYWWFKQRGLASRSNPRVGDLVIWREHGRISHMGIYVGGGRVISALINPWGVRKTSVRGLGAARLLAYLHVGLDR